MRSPIEQYLLDLHAELSGLTGGTPYHGIPAMADADPGRFAICLATVDGYVYEVGDADDEFTIQSISKPFAYALALADRGLEAITTKVGVEPSGDAFNSISLEPDTGRPRNPMINAGAIATHGLTGAPGLSAQQRIERVVAGLSAFAGRDLKVDDDGFGVGLSFLVLAADGVITGAATYRRGSGSRGSRSCWCPCSSFGTTFRI